MKIHKFFSRVRLLQLNLNHLIAQTKTNKPSLNIPNIQNITSITETNKTNDNLDGNMNQLENTFTLSELHTNLILISKINAGNKLTIKNNLLNIDVSSMPSFTISRHHSITHNHDH